MRKNKILKKTGVITTGITTFLLTNKIHVFADPSSALTSAKNQLNSQIIPIVNNVVVPIISSLLVVILLVCIARAVLSYRRGGEVELLGILALIAGIVLVVTFPSWGWAMIR